MTRHSLLLPLISMIMAVGLSAQPATKALRPSDRDRLIGAWHLVRIEAPGPDGKIAEGSQPAGMLLYTRDGHVSVQLMYEKTSISNEYVDRGYEASFGSFDLDEANHLITHRVLGSVTRDKLVGRSLPRHYEFSPEGNLLIRSADPNEHWSVTWQKY